MDTVVLDFLLNFLDCELSPFSVFVELHVY